MYLPTVRKMAHTCLNDLPDGVSSAQTEPLRQRAVLSHLLGENSLSAEGLLRRLKKR